MFTVPPAALLRFNPEVPADRPPTIPVAVLAIVPETVPFKVAVPVLVNTPPTAMVMVPKLLRVPTFAYAPATCSAPVAAILSVPRLFNVPPVCKFKDVPVPETVNVLPVAIFNDPVLFNVALARLKFVSVLAFSVPALLILPCRLLIKVSFGAPALIVPVLISILASSVTTNVDALDVESRLIVPAFVVKFTVEKLPATFKTPPTKFANALPV